ncbi:MAG: FAD-dependent oxidoreductase [Marinicaulis sp.]|nr:FAD-dependent oxidoreductase [Marinicaulis sp.]
MPFEDVHMPAGDKSIAIIGGGISGLAAAYYLAPQARVTLFEAENRLGGHARTIMAGRRRETPVDTGFMVFNDQNYPLLNALFDNLDVPAKPTNMSFAVSLDGGKFEYGLHNPKRLFADPTNIMRPEFWGMLCDIIRFNRHAEDFIERQEMTLGETLDTMKLSRAFRERYLFPLAGAIWSTPVQKMLEFPAATLIRFFKNHSLLSATNNPRWRTVDGGSREYVARLEKRLREHGCDVRTGAPVEIVARAKAGVIVKTGGAEPENFDEVIFACHSDQALALLSDASPGENEILGAMRYRPNRVFLHSDERMMPRRKACWSAWNYLGAENDDAPNNSFTYWMNLLQGLPEDEEIFVSLNPVAPVREELIYDETVLSHPVFDLPALNAQKRLHEIQGIHNTWFCGAYARYGFHEDGINSAASVVNLINNKIALDVAA